MKSRLLTTIAAFCLCFSAVFVTRSANMALRLPTGLSGEVPDVAGHHRRRDFLNNGRRRDRNCSGK